MRSYHLFLKAQRCEANLRQIARASRLHPPGAAQGLEANARVPRGWQSVARRSGLHSGSCCFVGARRGRKGGSRSGGVGCSCLWVSCGHNGHDGVPRVRRRSIRGRSCCCWGRKIAEVFLGPIHRREGVDRIAGLEHQVLVEGGGERHVADRSTAAHHAHRHRATCEGVGGDEREWKQR